MQASLAASVFAAAIGHAAPGQLDPTFGRGGVVTTNFGWGPDFTIGRTVIRQTDGKLVVGGNGWKGGGGFTTCVALIRFNADGSPDVSFGDQGRVLRLFDAGVAEGFEGLYGLAQQPDGKLLALGRIESGEGDMTLLRYGVDGSIDETFGAAGAVGVPLQVFDGVPALVRQPDGKLVVAGVLGVDDRTDLALARFLPDGSLDGEFGDAGRATLDVGGYGWANALTLQDDGKLVVAGAASPVDSNDVRILVARILPDGTPDSSFGTGGVIITNPTAEWDQALGVMQQADGRLIVVGYVTPQTDGRNVAVLRYLPNGALDPTFATAGMWTGSSGGDYAVASGVVQQPDGRLVVTAAGNVDFVTLRFSSSGALDPTFGSGGVVRTDIGSNDESSAVIRQPDGKLVVAGTGSMLEEGSSMAIVRYDATGALDPSFGLAGISLASAESTFDTAEALLVQNDGKIVAAGEGADSFALARYDLDGGLDPSFGIAGKVVTALGGTSARAIGIVQQGDGKLVAGGDLRSALSSSGFAVARFLADGSLDLSFGTGGKRVVGAGSEASAFLQQSDGRLVLAGRGNGGVVMVRFQTDGSLDGTFGSGGVVLTTALASVDALAQQSDGRLVMGGSRHAPFVGSSFAVARYDANGTLDTTFGTGGTVWISPPGPQSAYDLLQQPDGKLVGAGYSALVRLTASGGLDPSFAGGMAPAPIGLYAVRRQADGKLVGTGVGGFLGGQLSLTRHDSMGAIDTLFGNGGVASVPNDAFESWGLDVVVLPDGKLVAAGYSDTDFVIVRFLGDDPPTTTTTHSSTTTTSSSTSSSVVTTTLTTSTTSSTLACPDADGDGICDPSDPCINVGGARSASRGRIVARNLQPPAGDDVLLIAGIIALARPIDPLHDGIRVLYRDAQGTILDRIVPGGAYDPLTRTGWIAQGAGYRYVNGNGSLELAKIVLRGSASVPGQYNARIKGRGGSFAGDPNALPVSAVLMFAPRFTGSDDCSEWRFSAVPPTCLLSAGGASLKCR